MSFSCFFFVFLKSRPCFILFYVLFFSMVTRLGRGGEAQLPKSPQAGGLARIAARGRLPWGAGEPRADCVQRGLGVFSSQELKFHGTCRRLGHYAWRFASVGHPTSRQRWRDARGAHELVCFCGELDSLSRNLVSDVNSLKISLFFFSFFFFSFHFSLSLLPFFSLDRHFSCFSSSFQISFGMLFVAFFHKKAFLQTPVYIFFFFHENFLFGRFELFFSKPFYLFAFSLL